MSEITYVPTFQSLPNVEVEKVERSKTITPQDIFKKDEPDANYEQFFNPYIFSMAKQIKQQRRWVDMAHVYSENMEKSKAK